MGNLNKNSASSFNFKKVEIITRDGESYRLAGNYVLGFTYYEDVNTPYISANLNINDSGLNLIANGPIQGGEEVNIEISSTRSISSEGYHRSNFLNRTLR